MCNICSDLNHFWRHSALFCDEGCSGWVVGHENSPRWQVLRSVGKSLPAPCAPQGRPDGFFSVCWKMHLRDTGRTNEPVMRLVVAAFPRFSPTGKKMKKRVKIQAPALYIQQLSKWYKSLQLHLGISLLHMKKPPVIHRKPNKWIKQDSV